ncbi:MAG: signal recognition particle protein [Buchnera aphidicola (Eriosoma harunire)]
MFTNLTERLSKTIKNISNQGRITEKNIKNTLREIRKALLEADVSLLVIKNFIKSIKNKCIGDQVNHCLTPGQEFLKIIKKELVITMGAKNNTVNLSTTPPAIILIVGLQGSGKTTTVAKLGNFIKKQHKKKILITSIDVYRLAAIKQLQILSKEIDIDFFFPDNNISNPIEITTLALQQSKIKIYDILIIDTAGRLHNNTFMMNEIKNIYNLTQPIETLFVIDSMIGQDSINIINNFNNTIPISGVILTKTDGDSRGGVALSIRYLTNIPIKFIGTGEKINDLQSFKPEQIASKILGMEDILSIITNIEKQVDQKELDQITKKINKGHAFNLNDFLTQIKQIKNMDNVVNILTKIPKNKNLIQNFYSCFNEKTLIKIEAIINSMTPKERQYPEIIKGSRKKRIAIGSSTNINDINTLLKKFEEAKRMIIKIKNQGINNILNKIKHNLFL